MTKKMLIDAAHPEEVRVAVIANNKKIEDFDFESAARKPLRGNIYLARVTRVEPSLQAAFVEYGGNRHGFLAFSEIHPDYYQIPVSDRQALQEAEAEVAELASALELSQRGDEDDEDDRGRDDDDAEDTIDAADDADESELVDDADHSEPDEEEAPTLETDDSEGEDEPAAEAASATNENDDGDDADEASDVDDAPEKMAGDEEAEEEEEEEEASEKKPRRRPRRKKAKAESDASETEAVAEEAVQPSASAEAAVEDVTAEDTTESEEAEQEDAPEQEAASNAASDGSDNDGGDDEPADAELAEGDADAEEDRAEDADERDADATETEADVAAADTEDKKRKRKKKKDRENREALFERYKEAKRKRSRLLRNYKIQEVIKRRQILLVQVVKEERGNKGAALTTYMSLAGRYCVLMPNTARGGGISRKIANGSDRKRLRRVVDSLEVPQGMGLIIRTAGAKRTKTEIKRDYDYLLRLWENIRTLTLKSIAPCLIYEEASLIKRAIRDLYDKDISKVLVEGEDGYREAKDFMKMLMPSHAKNVQPYKERTPIFLHHGVETQLDGMYQPSVRLKSGGYLVIHQTEALVAIDVNSGRATRERNIEQTALRTNIEAAEEAARQFRLRDLAGLVVIDFIDMEEPRNNRKVEKAFKEAIKADRARIQTGRISAFGLLELSRQRRRSGIVYGTTHACPTCSGAGVIRSHEMAALRILRAIEGEAITGKAGKIVVHASQDVCLHVLNHNRDWLNRIETENGVDVEILADAEKAGDGFDIEKSGTPRERPSEQAPIRADQTEPVEIEEAETAESEPEQKEGAKRRRRRRSRKDARAERPDSEETASADDEAETEASADGEQTDDSEQDDAKPKRRRRRGRRGGRRARRAKDGSDEATQEAVDNSDDHGAPETVATPLATAGGEDAPDTADEPEAAMPDTTPPEDDEPAAAPEPSTGNGAQEPDDAPAPAPAEASEPAPEAAPAPAAAEEEVEQPAPEAQKKSARKGWWQRAIG